MDNNNNMVMWRRGALYISHTGVDGDEDFSKEMAKLDMMEQKRNHLVLSEIEEASPDNKDTAEGREDGDDENPVPGGGDDYEGDGAKGNDREAVPPGGGLEGSDEGGNDHEEIVGADAGVKNNDGVNDGELVWKRKSRLL